MILEVSNLTKRFGGLLAVNQLDFIVEQGETVGLIGPNGAGKTTAFNLITGVICPTRGKVIFKGRDITGKSPHVAAHLGIGRTFQLTNMFPEFTVLENVVQSYYLHARTNLFSTFFNLPSHRQRESLAMERAREIIDLVGLHNVRDTLARNLPHGFQKMLGIARALAVEPELVLLDEPLGGMNPDEIIYTMATIKKLKESGKTILVIEHNMKIMDLCHRIIVINFGQKIAEDTPENIRNNPEVVQAYLGCEYVT